MNGDVIRIGCAAGFWGDSPAAAAQLLAGPIDVLVFDYLSEVTMSILARARARDPQAGYARDFVRPVMAEVLPDLVERGVKVVCNAGGVNPAACRDELLKLAESLGLRLRVAVVEGDDLLARAGELRQMGLRAMEDGGALPQDLWSVNAYLGAQPIAAALAGGAQVVITGRCVDSALVLGPLLHAFGWAPDDYDRLAAGSLAGHVVECGCQATGGLFTDWREVPGWDDMGFPIVECRRDGSFVVTKPAGTGGLVTPATVAEQILYEVHDPATYLLPDVTCDFTQVRLSPDGPGRVLVEGARGRAPGPDYKVSATFGDGFRATAMFTIVGAEAAAKAQRVGESILARTRRLFAARGLGDYRRSSIKLIGSEEAFGPHARPEAWATREVMLRIDVHHDRREAVEVFSREIAPAGTAMAPGRCSLVGGRPDVMPVVRLFSCLVPKAMISPRVALDGESLSVPPTAASQVAPPETPSPAAKGGTELPIGGNSVPLIALAHGRSGDKGNTVNIGIIARRPDDLPLLRRVLTPEAVGRWLGHLAGGPVRRYEVPGLGALNFVLENALDGGGTASLRNDPLGKTFAQILLTMPVPGPAP